MRGGENVEVRGGRGVRKGVGGQVGWWCVVRECVTKCNRQVCQVRGGAQGQGQGNAWKVGSGSLVIRRATLALMAAFLPRTSRSVNWYPAFRSW